jgi:hypothetical protein
MFDQLLATVDRQILTWPGISKVYMAGGDAPGGFHVPPATVYNLGRRHLGHIHVTGTVDLSFPRAVCDELVASGKAIPHPAGLADTVTTYLSTEADIPNIVALFRLSYDRAQAAVARRNTNTTGESDAA